MQINVDDRGALILALAAIGLVAGVFAPDAIMGVLDGVFAAIEGVMP